MIGFFAWLFAPLVALVIAIAVLDVLIIEASSTGEALAWFCLGLLAIYRGIEGALEWWKRG